MTQPKARLATPAHRILLILALVTSCLQGARAPSVEARGVLAPGNDEASRKLEGAFDVVFGSPQGDADDPSEISLVFNRPMRPLELAGEESHAPAVIEPAVKGSFRWVGTNALTFAPDGHLPRATDFKVTVPAGTKALDGTQLGKTYELRFSTPAPSIVRSEPAERSGHLTPQTKFTLRWNQPVADAEVVRAVKLFGADRSKGAIAFAVRRPDPQNQMLTELAPKTPLPKDSAIEIVAAGDLHGTEGPRTSGKEQTLTFQTFGPLKVEELACDHDTPHGKCAPTSEVSLRLSNAVKIKDLQRAIVIEPPVPLKWSSSRSEDDTTTWLTLDGKFGPARSFTVRLRSSFAAAGGAKTPLRDEYGQALGQDWVGKIDFDDFWPRADIGVQGVYLEASEKRDIPVLAVNMHEARIVSKALRPDEVFAFGPAESSGRSNFDRIVDLGASPTPFRPVAPKNVAAKTFVHGDDVLGGKSRRGPIAVAVSYIDRPGTSQSREASTARIVQVTDLAISAKVSHEGTLVWVTRLSTGEPVTGASVEVKRSPREGGASSGSFQTDGDGFVTIPKERFVPVDQGADSATIFVREGDDWAYRYVLESLSSWRFGASIETGNDEAPIGMVFTERGLYRPGDTVKVKGIVREARPRGTATPAGKEVRLTLNGPEGESISEHKAILSAFGTFAFDVKVPETGKLGSYALAASLGDHQNDWRDIRGSFEVAEYRPAEFKVGVDAVFPAGATGARASSYVRGDKGNWTISGDFLFGAPMSKADVRYTITRTPVGFSPPMPQGFVTGEQAYTVDLPEASPRAYEVQNGRAQLDDKGRLAISAPLPMPGQREPERVSAEAEITDISRQSLSGNSSTLVHPGEFYVALKAGFDFFAKPNVAAQPEVLALDPTGVKRAQVSVHLDLVRRNFSLARQATAGGELHSVVTAIDKIAASCDVITQDAPVSCALTPTTSGYYVLHATAKDRRGNKVGAASSFYVIGDGEVGWGDNDEKRVELVPDHTTYEAGQTAHVLVKSPFKSADALVTVERAGIYSRRHVKVTGPTPTIDVPITDDLRPNAFVSVLLVRGRVKPGPNEGTDPDVGAPTFRAGYTMLSINPESRRLRVLVKANKDKFLPGEKVDVDVEVHDHKAKAAKSEVTLYAVDEGVLSLIAYKTPDPIPVFSAPRPLRVSTIESREALAQVKVGASALAGLDKGLEGGGGGEPMRRDFRQSVYFNPSLVTDAKGHAHASFTLPDSLTTYRIMAVAVAEDDRFGSADTPIVASKPLMARPAFPRVLRAGDSIDAGIVLTSKSLAKTKVDVTVAAEGLTLVSPAKRTVDLEANASLEVRFSFKAEHPARAKVSFRAAGGGAADAVEITRTVLMPAVTEAVALYGDTTAAAGEKLGDLSAMRDDVGGLELSVSSTALVGLAGGVDQLVEYPYGCTEQLTSRLVPMLPLRDLARDFQLHLPDDVDATVTKTVALVLANQRPDGGFGLWPDSRRSLPWVSTYALWGLGEAKRHGAEVPASAVGQATHYVQSALSDWDRDLMSAATAAFVVDVLAANGSPDPAWANRLYEDRKKLPLFAEALLLHAMAISKGDAKAIREMTREIEGHIRIDGPVARAVDNTGDAYAVLMDSEARTTALVLRGLLATQPSHPMAARIAKGLLADRKGGTWRSTQETAWALLALDDYRRAQEKNVPSFDARAFLGNAEILTASFHGRTAASQTGSVPAARVLASPGSTLAFELDGSGRLFYEARLRYAKKELPAEPLDRGFFVKKTMRAVRPEQLATAVSSIPSASASSFAGGDLVLADLVVVTPSPREFVVVDDPLPAGLEPVDMRLATTGASLDVDNAGEPATDDDYEGRDDRLATGNEYLSSWPRREMRDDRVLFFVDHMAAGMYHYRYLARATTFGKFVVPPTKAEEMYVPEVFGRSGAITVDVKGGTP
jgi:uncharacterized protein YfaS (alpha-2-macroglobulin family)